MRLVRILHPAPQVREHRPQAVHWDIVQSRIVAACLAHGAVSRSESLWHALPPFWGIWRMALILKRCMTGVEHCVHIPQLESLQSKVALSLGWQRIVITSVPWQGEPALLFMVAMCRCREHRPSAEAFVQADHWSNAQFTAVTPGVHDAGFKQFFASRCVPEHTMFPVPDELVKSRGELLVLDGFVVVISRLRCRLLVAAPQPVVGHADQEFHAPHLQ